MELTRTECANDCVVYVDRSEMTRREFRLHCDDLGFESWGGAWLRDMRAAKFVRYGCVIDRKTGKVYLRESLARAVELRAKAEGEGA